MALRRLAYPCRYSDMVSRFVRPVPVLCMITNHVIDYIYDTHHHRIFNWNQDIINPEALVNLSHAVSAKGSPLDDSSGSTMGIRPLVAADGVAVKFAVRDGSKKWLVASL